LARAVKAAARRASRRRVTAMIGCTDIGKVAR